MDDLSLFVAPPACRVIGRDTRVLRETGSTNDDARRAAAEGAAHGVVFVADAQTAGRGRLGRAWHSPPGANLYVSILLRPNAIVRELALLPLAAGLAAAEVVDALCGAPRAAIKWPNDVLIDGRKVAGVLVEGVLRGERFQHVVVGVGINVRGARPPDAVAELATTIEREAGREVARADALSALLTRFEARYDALESGEVDALHRAISARCGTLGARVTARGCGGVAVAIERDGGLRVRLDDGATQVLHGSDGVRIEAPRPEA